MREVLKNCRVSYDGLGHRILLGIRRFHDDVWLHKPWRDGERVTVTVVSRKRKRGAGK